MKSKLLLYFLMVPALYLFSHAQDASFYMTPTCDGAIATITGDTGGTFNFNPIPADGVVIDAFTGTVTSGISGATYTVEYTLSDSVPVTSTQTFTVIDVDIITPTPLETCMDIGFTEFDLSSKIDEILNGQVNVTLTFYETINDAVNGINALGLTYINFVDNQILYVRGEDLVNSCFEIVELELIAVDCLDSDNDGIIDSEEDLNGNGNYDDDDTDTDSIANYLDDDDDGDNVDSIIEINIDTGKTLHNFIDTDSDLIENYLDDDDDGDGILTKNEDYNNNGDPTDDDTNTNGIPDYLDNEVALSITNFNSNNFAIYPNPVDDIINVVSKSTSYNLIAKVYDLQGKSVLNIQLKGNSLDISKLLPGIYLLKIQEESNSPEKSFKILKK